MDDHRRAVGLLVCWPHNESSAMCQENILTGVSIEDTPRYLSSYGLTPSKRKEPSGVSHYSSTRVPRSFAEQT